MKVLQGRQEIKRGSRLKKELRMSEISGSGGGFLMGRERKQTCHRISHMAREG
jgi:hypothetical protein